MNAAERLAQMAELYDAEHPRCGEPNCDTCSDAMAKLAALRAGAAALRAQPVDPDALRRLVEVWRERQRLNETNSEYDYDDTSVMCARLFWTRRSTEGMRRRTLCCALPTSGDRKDATVSEQVWLIESASPLGVTQYWDGRRDNSFTIDPNEAVRFARFEDAERVRGWTLREPIRHHCRSVAHLWCAPSPAAASYTAEQCRADAEREAANGDADCTTGQPAASGEPLEEQAWFQNLTLGVRHLIREQANRHNRAHLLAAIDEAERRLRQETERTEP